LCNQIGVIIRFQDSIYVLKEGSQGFPATFYRLGAIGQVFISMEKGMLIAL
jgi:hypothetical protein